MNLIYTFTSKLYGEPGSNSIVDVYENSYINNSKYHNIILYTDIESINIFKNIFKNITIIDTGDIVLVDDMKYKVLPLLTDDDLLFDGDIFLDEELIIEKNYDIYCETLETINGDVKIMNTINEFIDSNVNDIKLPSPFIITKTDMFMLNVGVLKFRNKKIENLYFEYYYKLREWFIINDIRNKLSGDNKQYNFACTIAQHLLYIFSQHYKLNVVCADKKNSYVHLKGENKYRKLVLFYPKYLNISTTTKLV